jgi:hypothetical protein
MSWDVSTETNPKARKEYHCMASDWFENAGLCDEDFDLADRPIIAKARAENWKILPGTRYIKIKGIWEREASTFRARKDMDKICRKYELYDD